MLSLAIAALAAAAVCWPAGTGRSRLDRWRRRWAAPDADPSSRRWANQRWADQQWIDQRWRVLLVVLCTGLGTLLAGPGGGLAGAMASGTAAARWRAGRDRKAGAAAATGFSDALGVLVGELRAGAHPGEAIRVAGIDAHVDAGRALSAAAAAARLGGEVPVALRRAGTAALSSSALGPSTPGLSTPGLSTPGLSTLGPSLDRLADAWSLADRYGIPLADLLDAVRADTEHRVRFAAEIQARLAGARATSAVLAGLPLLGLALGHAVGAAPLQVLGGTAAGQVLLVVGTGLACAGVLWSARLVAGAVPA